jgi:hypothetical protein
MPAAFAAQKAWLAKEPEPQPATRSRAAAQAVAIVAALGGYVPPAIGLRQFGMLAETGGFEPPIRLYTV